MSAKVKPVNLRRIAKSLFLKEKRLPLKSAYFNEIKDLQQFVSNSGARDRHRKILDFRTPREVCTEIVQAKLAEQHALAATTVGTYSGTPRSL